MNSHKKHRRLGTVLVTIGGLAFCTAANAQAPANDECEGAITITCGSSGTTNNCTATSGVDDPFTSCTFGADFGSVYFKFQPTATSARVRTDLSSVAPDSEFVVYEVNQSNICDETQWTEVGCADDDPADFGFNGDICIEGLDTARTYVIALFSFSTASCGSYTVDIECPCSGTAVCGDGVLATGEDCDPGTPVVGDCCDDSCQFELVTKECRASAGVCDLADNCDGTSDTCPADLKKSSTTECRASAGVCDPADNCDGTNNDCPPDAKSTAQCRASAGVCDLAEDCDGTNNDCPADAKSTAECRTSAGVCDLADNCDGTNNDCPADAKSTAECRASAGDCDPAEDCDGTNNDCPADAKSTAECRASAGDCDPAEDCDGTNNDCPADAKSTAECRASAGDCDLADNCDGTNNDCPADAKSAAECRASAGDCDPAEDCDGTNNDCPADAKSTAQCRASAGDCDPAEDCDGTNNDCPTDLKEPSPTECRASTGVCDPAEDCNGTNDTCPSDATITSCVDGDGCCFDLSVCNNNTDDDCPPVCGNLVVEAGEACDDGNTDDGDGCSSTCGVEGGCGTLLVQVNEHTVGRGSGSTIVGIEGLELCVFDKSAGSCARDIGISKRHYQEVFNTCEPVVCETTDADGSAGIILEAGDYVLIGEYDPDGFPPNEDGDERFIGVSASDFQCAEDGDPNTVTMRKFLQVIILPNGRTIGMDPRCAAAGPSTSNAWVEITNVDGPDNSLSVTAVDEDLHAAARPYKAMGRAMGLDSSLSPGQLFMTILIPFHVGDLAGSEPLSVDLRYYNQSTGSWELAVASNAQPSPDHGPNVIGDRFAVVGSTIPVLSDELGDYGVFWDPALGEGLVWANVDYTAEFATARLAQPGAVPTVSGWGLIMMALLGLTIGTILYGRRRTTTASVR